MLHNVKQTTLTNTLHYVWCSNYYSSNGNKNKFNEMWTVTSHKQIINFLDSIIQHSGPSQYSEAEPRFSSCLLKMFSRANIKLMDKS